MIYRQYFRITGEANRIVYDSGLTSTPTEKKRLLSINVVLNGQADNQLQGYHEKAKVFDIPDRLIDVEADAFNTNLAKPGARLNEIEVGLEIPIGEVFRAALLSGATSKNVFGCYNYELIS
jgi:hypothetical protein